MNSIANRHKQRAPRSVGGICKTRGAPKNVADHATGAAMRRRKKNAPHRVMAPPFRRIGTAIGRPLSDKTKYRSAGNRARSQARRCHDRMLLGCFRTSSAMTRAVAKPRPIESKNNIPVTTS